MWKHHTFICVQSNILIIIRGSYLATNGWELAPWMGEHWGKTLATHGWGRGRRWKGRTKNHFQNCPWFFSFFLRASLIATSVFDVLFRFRLGIYRLTWKLDKDGNLENTRQGLAYCAYCKDVKEVVETVLTERVWNKWESVISRSSLSAERRKNSWSLYFYSKHQYRITRWQKV